MQGKLYFFAVACLLSLPGVAQEISSDSTLKEVVIQAYSAGRTLADVPASVGYLTTNDLQRYSNTSILPAVNSIAGVRMEERSPGSFRFSIRGSSLRSPFGVRNVKVYWNGLPFTDAGGNTYLNLIDLTSIGNVEVIKGPGGSLYGAGTGGVILFNRPVIQKDQISFSALAGSYGLQRYAISGQLRNENLTARSQFSRQQSNGYREQSAMRRNTFNTDLSWRLNSKNILTATILYTDLFYETPGGLTQIQFDENPKQARPSTNVAGGAVAQNASVNNDTFFGGLSHDVQFNDDLSLTTGLYTSFTTFSNYAIANYETRDEKNVGGRSALKYQIQKENFGVAITGGGEFQFFNSPIKVYANNGGVQGEISSDSDLTSVLALLFAQTEFSFSQKLYVTLGVSANVVNVDYESTLPANVNASRNFKAEYSPRVALLGKVTDNISLYGSLSKGFSPPTIAELYPSLQIFNQELNPEKGTNLELGVKGNVFNNAFYYELTGYDFRLKETIVIRRDPSDAEYFINAGRTKQRGLEASVNWTILNEPTALLSNVRLSGSYAYNHYRFEDYVSNVSDLTGNKLTGVPPTTFFAGLDLTVLEKFYGNFSINYVDHIPLNDANTVFASSYVLSSARIGFKTTVKKHFLDVFLGIDNAFNETYSLGNDLNAFGGRYFNAAAPRNYYAGLRFDLSM
jgi:iron complex outermembrane receptor protein